MHNINGERYCKLWTLGNNNEANEGSSVITNEPSGGVVDNGEDTACVGARKIWKNLCILPLILL